VYVYSVIPSAVDYWRRQGATVMSYAPENPFKDVVFDKEDFHEDW
jgi:hypothetical protein